MSTHETPAQNRRPGTRHFIGPLTEAQQRRRQRARHQFNDIAEMQYSRSISFTDAIKAVKWEFDHRFDQLIGMTYEDRTG